MPNYRHCITESAADRQRQFEAALLSLMGQKAFSQIGIQEICGRVGLSRKSFYRYFSSKEACLTALLDHAVLGFTEAAFPGETAKNMLESFFHYWLGRRELLEVLQRNGFGNLLYERGMVCAAQEYGIRSCFLAGDDSYEQTVFLISGLYAVLMIWYEDGCKKTPAQLAASLERYLKT